MPFVLFNRDNCKFIPILFFIVFQLSTFSSSQPNTYDKKLNIFYPPTFLFLLHFLYSHFSTLPPNEPLVFLNPFIWGADEDDEEQKFLQKFITESNKHIKPYNLKYWKKKKKVNYISNLIMKFQRITKKIKSYSWVSFSYKLNSLSKSYKLNICIKLGIWSGSNWYFWNYRV